MRRKALALAAALLVFALGVSAGALLTRDGGTSARTSQPGTGYRPKTQRALTDLSEINESLPPGFSAEAYAGNIPVYPTTMAVDGAGRVYVGGWKNPTAGAVFAYASTTGGARENKPTLFADGLPPITGLLVHGGRLLVASKGKVSSLRDTNQDLRADRRADLIKGLPFSREHPVHSNNGMAIGPDGRLYFGMGASCNACIEKNRLNGTVLRCDLPQGKCDVFATGLRNAYDVAFHPTDGALFTADNGIDPAGGAILHPEDEINVLVEGGDYGWPFCWGNQRGMECEDSLPALSELEPHSVPSGLTFYTGDQFPREYRNNLFVTLWGDTGRKVIRVQVRKQGGSYEANVSDFVRLSRPVDVVNARNGGLLVLDNEAQAIYRIAYSE